MIIINNEICDLCGACLSVCPANCLEIVHFLLKIDHDNCLKCEHCVAVCPLHALEMESNDKN